MSRACLTITDRQSLQHVEQIEFELLDNPGVRAWQYAVMLNGKSRDLRYRSAIHVTPRAPNADQLYSELVKIQKRLSGTEFAFPFHIPGELEQLDQDFFNLAHRHFTQSCDRFWDPRRDAAPDLDIDRVLHQLNDVVHQLELGYTTRHKQVYGGQGLEVWLPNDGHELGYDIRPFKKYHSFEPADLIMDAYILGKTLLEAFASHDDPTQWDVSGHVSTNGGAIVCLGATRHEIYQSQDFLDWLASWNRQPAEVFADFPLGNFLPGHRSRMQAVVQELLLDSNKYSAQLDIIL